MTMYYILCIFIFDSLHGRKEDDAWQAVAYYYQYLYTHRYLHNKITVTLHKNVCTTPTTPL